MRVAVTADVHLAPDGAFPERFEALEDIFLRMTEEGIDHLLIAGDLFDRATRDFSGFEEICTRFPGLAKHLIPGNHDPGINGRNLSCPCVSVYTEPELVELEGFPFLLVPYLEGESMGSAIARSTPLLPRDRWVLVGHGDLRGGAAVANPYEAGSYMPLSVTDIRRFDPWRVLLGHIHRPTDDGRVHYPGSPCGMDITERGRRRFLVLDTSTGAVEALPIRTGPLYFQETFLVLPGEEGLRRLEEEIGERIRAWGLEPGEEDRVTVRIRGVGYSSDRTRVAELLEGGFRRFGTYHDEGIDLSGLLASDDAQLNAVAELAVRRMEALDWSWGGDGPGRDAVRERILRTVYGKGGS